MKLGAVEKETVKLSLHGFSQLFMIIYARKRDFLDKGLESTMPWKTQEKSGLQCILRHQIARPIESTALTYSAESPATIWYRWGFGWVDKVQCCRSARRFGAVGLSPNFSRVCLRHLYNCRTQANLSPFVYARIILSWTRTGPHHVNIKKLTIHT